MSTTSTNSETLLHLIPARRYRDGEEFYQVDWKTVSPAACILDYDAHEDQSGFYAEIYDTTTGTPIARTRCFKKEEWSFNAAERIIDFLREEFDFEKDLTL